MNFVDTLGQKKVVVCVGAGGVGKTTISVAIGFLAACLGKKTLIMTIDPAKRLADALGVHVGEKPSLVVCDELLNSKWQPKAPLYGMMLDNQSAWQDLVMRLSPSKESSLPIFTNRFYRYLSQDMAGSQEFVSCEALYTLANESDFDLIVLDTPPTVHVLDFLKAPERVLSFLNQEAFRLFLSQKPGTFSKLGFHFLSSGNRLLQKAIGQFVPMEFLQELMDFMRVFSDLYDPLVGRAEAFLELLKSQETMFAVILAPRENAVRESAHLACALAEKQLNVGALIANQVSSFVVSEMHLLEQKKALQDLLLQTGLEAFKQEHVFHQIEMVATEEYTKAKEEQRLLRKLRQEVAGPLLIQCPQVAPGLALRDVLQALLPVLAK